MFLKVRFKFWFLTVLNSCGQLWFLSFNGSKVQRQSEWNQGRRSQLGREGRGLDYLPQIAPFVLVDQRQGNNRLKNRIEVARAQYLPLLWPVRQSGAAFEPNDIILTNLMTSHSSILFLSLFLPWFGNTLAHLA